MNEKELKIQALLEAMGKKYAEYESTIANLRVRLTIMEAELAEKNTTAIPQEEVNGG